MQATSRHKRLAAAAIILAGLIAGCAAPTRSVSNRASDYENVPKRVFVVYTPIPEWTAKFNEAAMQGLKDYLGSCGAAVEYGTVSSLDLDQNALNNRMQAFRPDARLRISRGGGLVGQYGELLRMKFDAELYDFGAKRSVWRGNFDFVSGGLVPREERGRTLASDITNKMIADRIFPNCRPIVPKT
jgi:hypothetical protein